MNLVTYLLKSRGPVNAARRLPTIASRFGISCDKMDRALNGYVDLAETVGTAPSLAVTGNLVERYPHVFQRLAERGAELAIHGYVHTDYASLPLDRQREDLGRTKAAFEQIGIDVAGFRGPYLRWNDDSVTAAKDIGLTYGSNRAVAWEALPDRMRHSEAMRVYEKGLSLYGAKASREMQSLPAIVNGLLDLPASLPDDEALVDRLRLSPRERADTWCAVLDQVYERGEMYVFILHHERFQFCGRALAEMLSRTRREPAVWAATMREIAAWWTERSAHRLSVEKAEGGKYRIVAPNDARYTVLARNVDAGEAFKPWYGWYRAAEAAADLVVGSEKAPAVGLTEDAPAALEEFLVSEGFAVRRNDLGDCAVVLDGPSSFGEADKRRTLDQIEAGDAPLVRLWRWPNGARCALSLSGDVDSMNIVDFLRRPLEV